VAEVGLDHVGVIFGIEMSRLARSCKDWYQLLEVCALFGTLIADLDGIYDPAQYNDRLLLGLKGTMSEAELHIIKQRMHQGKLNKARRGELGFPLPIGYCKRPSGEVVLDPDEQAQSVVRLIFEQFERLGTVDGLLRYLVAHGIRLPVRSREGTTKGELEWHRPNRTTLHNMLHNPTYAGAYAYGRRQADRRRQQPGRPGTGRVTTPPEKWPILLRDRRPAYITWEQYERNRLQLEGNRSRAYNRGVARNGAALLAGLIWCGRCGKKMYVHYHSGGGADSRNGYSYVCSQERSDYGGPLCQHFSGALLDEAVSQQALQALQPAALEVSLRVAEDLEAEQDRLDGQWRSQLERARYDADRAERQYHAVEPENRLVARTVEKAWEEKLAAERKLQEEFTRFRTHHAQALTTDQREQILALASDIPALWRAKTTTNVQRSEILRQLLERVIVTVEGRSEILRVCLMWSGGYKTSVVARRPVRKAEHLSYWTDLLQRVKTLRAQGRTSGEIANSLNQEGWKPTKRASQFSAQSVRTLMSRNGVTSIRRPRTPTSPRLKRNEWWLPQLAAHLEVPVETLYSWMRRGWLHAKQMDGKQGRWLVWAPRAEVERLKRLRARERRRMGNECPDATPAPRPAGW
jgi:DNA invertase Pin-like site-specific DNA recombinase